ncbi:MAG: 5'-nucleotidase C-terminal domain-containing protein [Candidatus Adiutrix sp.]|jgi:2',3'-cyclic-nucleotide 2'-phosphodiesterase (5'-nucleotidase family)|nr:5'-nucleotidase C-terminal domain-containing protein [Candidatus Adiutrix sp.]
MAARFWLAVLAVFFGLVSGGQAAEMAPLKIIITTDIHGYVNFDPSRGYLGLARLQGYVTQARSQGWETFLLDSGDAFSGCAYAQVDRGRSVAALMGRLGYRVLTPGNHAFDHNQAEGDPLYYSHTLLETVRANSPGPVEALALNLSYQGGPLPGVARSPVVIFDETAARPDGRRVVVTGVITPYAARASLKDSLAGYDFGRAPGAGPSAAAATKSKILADLAESLKPYDRPNDWVIVLSHVGQNERAEEVEGRLLGPDLAAVPNVDFVADGHSHQEAAPQKTGSAVYGNGGHYLTHFLEIDLGPDSAGMKLKTFAEAARCEPDQGVAAAVAALEEQYGLNEVLLVLPDSDLFRAPDRGQRSRSTPLGRLIARSMARAAGAEVALHSQGGIRSGLLAGPVTVREFYDVIPFANDLLTYRLTGRELGELFESYLAEGRGFQFYGLTAQVGPAGSGAGKDQRPLYGLTDSLGRLEPNQTYLVAVDGFLAGSGHGFSFRDKPLAQNHGDLTAAVIGELRTTRELNLDELRSNNIQSFKSRAEALAATAPLSSERPDHGRHPTGF